MAFRITTDSCSDLPDIYIKENNIGLIRMKALYDGKEVEDSFRNISAEEFYDSLSKGSSSSTFQINPAVMSEFLKENLKENKELIHLGLSSGLSGTYSSALIAKDMVLDDPSYKDCKIEIIDTKAATLGLGMLVFLANEYKQKGKTFEETVDLINQKVPYLNHWFTVDDLNFLKRGGRISGVAAAVGTMLALKPVIHMDDQGKLVPVTKVKGRKKTINKIFEYFKEMYVPSEDNIVFISHANAKDDAEYLMKLITEEFDIRAKIINSLGLVIGSHTGPGAVALFFMGKNREDFKK